LVADVLAVEASIVEVPDNVPGAIEIPSRKQMPVRNAQAGFEQENRSLCRSHVDVRSFRLHPQPEGGATAER
jgi:hypothetical protein